MELPQLVAELKDLVGDAKLEKALEQLDQFLESDKRYKNLHYELVQLQAQYKRAKRNDASGTIPSSEANIVYNRVSQSILELVRKLETGSLESASGNTPKWQFFLKTPRFRLALSLFSMLLLTSLGLWFFIKPNGLDEKPNPIFDPSENDSTGEDCTLFPSESAFNILLLPFQTLDGNSLNPHLAIRNRLSNLSEKYNIASQVDVKIFNDLDFNDPNAYPANGSEATLHYGQPCKAQLVIWGTSEDREDQDIYVTQYKFLEKGERFAFQKLSITEETLVDTVKSLTSIATEGVLTEDIEESIRLIFGLVAHETNNNQVAIDALESIHVTDSASALVKGVFLADSHLGNNELDKALATYDTILQVHPDYNFALNNRGILLYQQGKYQEAVEDLSNVIDHNPQDTAALLIRGSALMHLELLKEAKDDFDEAKKWKKDDQDPNLTQRLDQVTAQIEERKVQRKTAEQELQANQGSLSSRSKIALAEMSLGEYNQAIQEANKVLRRDPNNKEAFSTLIRAFFALGDTTNYRKAVKQAKEVNVEVETLLPLRKSRLKREIQ